MKDLVEAFDHLAVRGTPRGADAVFDAASEYVTLAPDPPRIGTTRRFSKVLLAAAACIALLATGAIIANRVSDDSNAGELNDVNPEEALPLAQTALITPDQIGSRWRKQDPFTESVFAEQTAATIAALPDCAMLTSFGLFSPTTKSVAARQAFTIGNAEDIRHTVFVFATPEDASRAMDIIDGDIYPKCWFNLYDHLAPLGRFGAIITSTSEAWDAPQIALQGDRQVIIGQHMSFTSGDGPFDAHIINAYVQTGRAISWIAPTYHVGANLFPVDKMISATATALDEVFRS